jgi:hypothetical protein
MSDTRIQSSRDPSDRSGLQLVLLLELELGLELERLMVTASGVSRGEQQQKQHLIKQLCVSLPLIVILALRIDLQ